VKLRIQPTAQDFRLPSRRRSPSSITNAIGTGCSGIEPTAGRRVHGSPRGRLADTPVRHNWRVVAGSTGWEPQKGPKQPQGIAGQSLAGSVRQSSRVAPARERF